MKKLLTAFALMFALVFSVSAMAKEDAPKEVEGATTVSAAQIFELMDEHEDLVLVDVRKEADYDAGHIEGAVRVINDDAMAENLANVLATKDTPALFYCNGPKCGRGAIGAKVAVDAGYTKVFYFFGGMEEWKAENLPVVVK